MNSSSRKTDRTSAPHHRCVHFACLVCRVSSKVPSDNDLLTETTRRAPCPECGRPMQYMGRTFQAPRRSAVRKWRVVERLIQAGYRFESMGNCSLPTTQRELEEFLRDGRPTNFNLARARSLQNQAEARSEKIGAHKRKRG